MQTIFTINFKKITNDLHKQKDHLSIVFPLLSIDNTQNVVEKKILKSIPVINY
jgi:hypothetical protein